MAMSSEPVPLYSESITKGDGNVKQVDLEAQLMLNFDLK